jgi:hypothetical protein
MIISLILSAMMLAAIGAGLMLRRRAPAVGAAIALAALCGLYFVWMPAHLSAVANALGVGRGTDLLLYLWVSLTMLALAALVLELRHLQRQLTVLAREQALLRARYETPAQTSAAAPVGELPTVANGTRSSAGPGP